MGLSWFSLKNYYRLIFLRKIFGYEELPYLCEQVRTVENVFKK